MKQESAALPDQSLSRSQRRHGRRLVRAASRAALGTILAGGDGLCGVPYVSLVTVATDHDGSPILLLSTIADHTRNIAADPRVSLLCMDAPAQDNPQQDPRVTLLGALTPTDDPQCRARFLARHPGAALYADFADFSFYRMTVERAHFVGGFARAAWISSILAAASAARTMAAAEADILARTNADHADILASCANALVGDTDTKWRMTAVDIDGFDVRRLDGESLEDRVFRIAFNAPLPGPESVPEALSALAEKTLSRP